MLVMQKGEFMNTELLRELRLDHGLSQRRLSELAGVSSTTVWHIERGAAARPDTIKKIADVFGIRASELVKD